MHVFCQDVFDALNKHYPDEDGLIRIIKFGWSFVKLLMDRNTKVVLKVKAKNEHYPGMKNVLTFDDWTSQLKQMSDFITEWKTHAARNQTTKTTCIPAQQIRDIVQMCDALPQVLNFHARSLT